MGNCIEPLGENGLELNNENTLFNSFKLGPNKLKNRFVMAAMTRCRADPTDCVPVEKHVKYYSERAKSAGLILTECAGVSFRGNGYLGACGIWTDEQVAGWKLVNDAVHKVGGIIYLQVFHIGRAGRSKDIGNVQPYAPSKIPIRLRKIEGSDRIEYGDEPHELTLEEINDVIEEFRKGAENAKKAGFDGIELHGANGDLVDQFLKDCTNQRTDRYGGSIENRCNFALEAIDALVSVFGADRVGIKLSPSHRFNDMFDSNPTDLYHHLLKELSKKKISFVEMVQTYDNEEFPNFYGVRETEQLADTLKLFKSSFKGVYMANNNITFEMATEIVANNTADLVSFGRPFLANPDLVQRFLRKHKLNDMDYTTAYYGGEKGYNDYPKMTE